MPRELVAVGLGLISAVFIACGLVMRQRSTMHVPHAHAMGTGMATALVCQPLWWGGTAVAVGGYGFQALALGQGSLVLVQPLLVTSLLFALPLSAHLAHRRVTRREWTWALLLTIGIALFVVLGNPRSGRSRPPLLAWGLAATVIVPVVIACVWWAHGAIGRRRAVLLAVAVALLFAVVSVLTKVSVGMLERGGPGLLLTHPAVYVLVAIAVVTVGLQQSALHAGALQVSVPTMLVLEPIVAVSLGILVLGEHLNVSRFGGPGLVVIVAMMVAATAALARDAALHELEAVAEVATV